MVRNDIKLYVKQITICPVYEKRKLWSHHTHENIHFATICRSNCDLWVCVCVAYKLSSLDNKNEKDSSVHRIAENFHWCIIFVWGKK